MVSIRTICGEQKCDSYLIVSKLYVMPDAKNYTMTELLGLRGSTSSQPQKSSVRVQHPCRNFKKSHASSILAWLFYITTNAEKYVTTISVSLLLWNQLDLSSLDVIWQTLFPFEVFTAESQQCEHRHQIRLPSPHGRIASLTTFESRWCGTAENPWLIEVPPGQRINITLIDFGLGSGQVI